MEWFTNPVLEDEIAVWLCRVLHHTIRSRDSAACCKVVAMDGMCGRLRTCSMSALLLSFKTNGCFSVISSLSFFSFSSCSCNADMAPDLPLSGLQNIVYGHAQWRTQEFCSWGVSTNSVEDRGQRERGSGGGSPLVRGSGGSCNFIQEISFRIVRFS